MFCSIYKWKISQALDSGKPASSRVQRHMAKCDSCREYAELCTSLKPKFNQDTQALLENFDESLNAKIMAGIPEKPGLELKPRGRARAPRRAFRKPALIPSLAAAFTVLAVSIGIIFLSLPRSEQAPSLGRISTLISTASPEEMLSRMESPLEKEYDELKRAFESTSKYLISSLDFRIGQQAK